MGKKRYETRVAQDEWRVRREKKLAKEARREAAKKAAKKAAAAAPAPAAE